MPDQTQLERILRIIQILSSGTFITTNELMTRFEGTISRRTLQRDFNSIQSAGIPLQSRKTRANENEWYLEAPFRSFYPRTLDLNEYLASYILREHLKVFRNTNFSTEIDSLIDKIEQIVPDDVFMKTDEIDPSQLYENYSSGMYDYSGSDELIADLIKAILEKRTCFVRYYNADEEKHKAFYIEPRRLVYYSGSLYVVGYIRRFDNFILLAVQRIHKLKIQDSVFPDEPVFDAQSFWAGKFGLFSAESTQVRLKFKKEIRHHIEGRTWHASQSLESDSDGNLHLEMTVGLTPELISWILGWSDYVKVQGPPELVEMVKERIQAMFNIYKRGKSK